MRRLIVWLLLAFSGLAWAVCEPNCTVEGGSCFQNQEFAAASVDVGWHPSIAAACTASVGKVYNGKTILRADVFGASGCTFWRLSDYNVEFSSTWASPRRGVVPNVCPTCESGETVTKNVRLGFARYSANSAGALWETSDGRGYMTPQGTMAPIPETSCDGTCSLVADGAAGEWWYDNEANGSGLHEIFREQGYMKTGATCTALDDSINPNKPPPACDGYLGTVNGKQTCVGKDTMPPGMPTPAGVKPTESGAGSTGTPTPGNNPNGSAGGKTGPNGEVPGKSGDKAGLLDLGGTGSGSLTGGGTSSTSKGTTTAADGTISTTESEDPITCGLPGTPPCKIDESGTPSGKGALGEGDAARDAWEADAKAKIEGHKTLTAPGWTWTFQLPTGCTNFSMPAFNYTLDVCRFQPEIHAALSILWLMAGVFFGLSIVSRGLRGG